MSATTASNNHILTQYEIHHKLRPLTKELARYTRASTRNRKYIAKRQQQIEILTTEIASFRSRLEQEEAENQIKKYTSKIKRHTQIIEMYTRYMDFYQRHLSNYERKIQQMEQQVEQLEAMKGKYLSPVASQPSEPIVLSIRLFSGDLLHLSVDRSHPVAGFADQFAEQMGYASSAVTRMVFLIAAEEKDQKQEQEQEEEKDQVFWSPEERHHGLSIGDLLGPTTPLLHLVIRPSADLYAEQKAMTLRRILRSLQRDDSLDNEALFELYTNWLLTTKIPSTYNRYQKMTEFITQSEDLFPVLTDSHRIEQQRRFLDLDAFRSFRNSLHTYRRHLQDMGRQGAQGFLQRHGQDAILRPDQLYFYLTIFTVPQFFDLGFTVANLPKKYKYYRFLANWTRYAQEADSL
jgi:hypothetical protein